jgi:hypothetical protein
LRKEKRFALLRRLFRICRFINLPIEVPQSVKIGSFNIDLSDSLKQVKDVSTVSGILKATLSTKSSCSSKLDHGSQSVGNLNSNSKFIWKQKSSSKGFSQCTVEQDATPRVTRRNSFPHVASPSSLNCSANYSWELNRIRRLGGCVCCLDIYHSKSNCSFSLGVLLVSNQGINLNSV